MSIHPFSWFLTFHPYGTWLPGDARGWTNPKSVRRGITCSPPSPALEAFARALMRQPPLYFDGAMRSVVSCAIVGLCVERAWTLHDHVVTRTHLHILCTARARPTIIRTQFKARATKVLRGEGLLPPDRIVWARGGSTRPILTLPRFARVVDYIDHHGLEY